ncbi:hypothetical protein [Methylibium sp.]|uniref:hypothetical protein n=1 Tax=Methylibium sp. TaxID=2067992 RepID=UPI00286C1A9C|nr:hypothetical protein [Methylibium sp.]
MADIRFILLIDGVDSRFASNSGLQSRRRETTKDSSLNHRPPCCFEHLLGRVEVGTGRDHRIEHLVGHLVDIHRRNIMRKLGLHTVAALTKYAVSQGLTSL